MMAEALMQWSMLEGGSPQFCNPVSCLFDVNAGPSVESCACGSVCKNESGSPQCLALYSGVLWPVNSILAAIAAIASLQREKRLIRRHFALEA
ncbi:hypothetical protein OE88DRAFT_1667376 [Heliocybe sulcata]|uniref:Uncharacterized protein n=1 Tax=Heliocybe sulcata TaxID=5364 RepID=A0A5C3MPL8_9AGAM|nr:hypothetical protein OE88DRAFT_1667376 [Heliocybe sulcata]